MALEGLRKLGRTRSASGAVTAPRGLSWGSRGGSGCMCSGSRGGGRERGHSPGMEEN